MNKPFVTELDDGTILIEFIKDDRRFGINLENDFSESGWYYASKEMAGGDMNCGEFSEEMIASWKKFMEKGE